MKGKTHKLNPVAVLLVILGLTTVVSAVVVCRVAFGQRFEGTFGYTLNSDFVPLKRQPNRPKPPAPPKGNPPQGNDNGNLPAPQGNQPSAPPMGDRIPPEIEGLLTTLKKQIPDDAELAYRRVSDGNHSATILTGDKHIAEAIMQEMAPPPPPQGGQGFPGGPAPAPNESATQTSFSPRHR